MNEDKKQLDENLEIYIPNGPRLGTNVIEVKNVAKAFGDKLCDNLNFTCRKQELLELLGQTVLVNQLFSK
jgi:ATPase subunit of ABC transporter with duplicated ATPase domains